MGSEMCIRDRTKAMDIGGGKGEKIKVCVSGGVVGLIIDARGRPLNRASDKEKRVAQLIEWQKAMSLYEVT